MLRNEGDPLTRVVVCTPRQEYFEVSDLAAHNINEPSDRERTGAQFEVFKGLLARRGAEVIDVPELSGHPNSVFTRDASLLTSEGYVMLRMGLETRRGEEAWMAGIVEGLGERCVGTIEPPGTLEGGDVILAGKVAFIGRSGRSNTEGVRQLGEILRSVGHEVRVATVSDEWMHLGGLMSAIAPDRILCCEGVLPEGFLEGFDVVEAPFNGPSTGNVVCLGPNEVVANAAENVETIRALEAHGVVVHGIDLSEFRKGAGGPTCLILPVARGA